MSTKSVLRVVDRLASVAPWPIERETNNIRAGDTVRVTGSDWSHRQFGTVVEIWSQDDGTQIALVSLQGVDEDVSFPVDDLVLRL
jgi:hypothetical protein